MNREAEMEQEGPNRPLITLAFEVMVHPRSAFDEIIRRRLLAQGLWIVAAAGVVEMVRVIVGPPYTNESPIFGLANSNPVSIIGWVIVYSWLAWLVARGLQGRGDYADLLTASAWSSVALLLANISWLLLGSWGFLLVAGFFIWGIVIGIIAVSEAMHVSGWRSFVAIAASFAVVSAVTVGMVFASKAWFAGKAPGSLALSLAGLSVRIVYAWVAAAAILAGSYCIRDTAIRLRWTLGLAGLASVIIAVAATVMAVQARPLAELRAGVQAYEAYQPIRGAAGRHFERILRCFPDDTTAHLYHAHSLAEDGDFKSAEAEYLQLARRRDDTDSGWAIGLGNAFYGQGKYLEALDALDKSEFSYPILNARLALAVLRTGDRQIAAGDARRAVKFGEDSVIPCVVLAQCAALRGDKKQLRLWAKRVKEIDAALAKRIEGLPGGWRQAVHALTPADLRVPLVLKKPDIRGLSTEMEVK